MIKLYAYTLLILFTSCKREENISYSVLENNSPFESEKAELIKKTELSPEEYTSWIKSEENHFFKTKEMNDVYFKLFYRPIPYIICNELKSSNISSKVYDIREQELEGYEHFILEIGLTEPIQADLLKHKISSSDEYQQRVQYLAYQVANDIQIIQNSIVIKPHMTHFERTFDVSPNIKIILAFQTAQLNVSKEFTFQFEDQIFQKGIIKITFEENTLNVLPKLKTI